MKVTVCFGKTGIVVPCKDGKISVRELIQQAAQRYIKAKEKEPGYWVKIHNLEYRDGGILDPDDVVADVVEDKDKLIAVFDELEVPAKAEDGAAMADRLSPNPFESEAAAQHPTFQPLRGEIEVTPSALKLGTPLLVRRSSDPSMGPVADFHPGSSHTAEQGFRLAVQAPPTEEQKSVSWQDECPRWQTSSDLTRTVELSGEGGPLGIHVVPFYSSLSGRALGLYIRGVEENSRTKRDGLFQENECIVKINDMELMDRSFTQAQDIFRQAMKDPRVRVEVLPSHYRELYEKSVISSLSILEGDDADEIPNIKPPPPPGHGKLTVKMSEQSNGADTALSLAGPDPTGPAGIYSSPSLSPLGFASKKPAKRIRIDLKKGADGLGFTVVTRDSTVHGPGPIFVKNILPKGAAITDGRLLSGDRIMEVNGIVIAGKTQEELVAMLRSTKLGETVALVVARQEEAFLPRELKGGVEGHFAFPEGTAQMTFEIPLNESGSAGLGASLKGNKSRETNNDLGIFIKSIIHGGAAFKEPSGLVVKQSPETLAGLEHNGWQDRVNDYGNFDEGYMDKDVPPPLPPHPREHVLVEYPKFRSGGEMSNAPDTANLKTSKSMDLVADERNMAALNGRMPDFPGKDLGPRLGLKKSSSLESLQTAVAEVKKNELPFYRPRPHMVRGRGCNESFRAAIDKSYDGPDTEEDALSDVSSHSGRETPNSESAPLGNPELSSADKAKKDKKKKDKKKEKEKGKTKVKEKKKKEEAEEQDKKGKKKGFGAMLRFGKKHKDDKGGKMDPKSNPKPGALKEEEQEMDKIKEERDRINAKHQEIREKQARVLFDFNAANDIEDDDMDPNYARVNHFKEPPPHFGTQRSYSPPVPAPYSYPRDPLAPAPERDHVQDLYAKINKKQQAPDAADRKVQFAVI